MKENANFYVNTIMLYKCKINNVIFKKNSKGIETYYDIIIILLFYMSILKHFTPSMKIRQTSLLILKEYETINTIKGREQ